MRIIKNPKQLQKHLLSLRCKGKRVGFVPTMGDFHQGHLNLMKKSKQDNDATVVSLFVNPTQFGPKEDYKKYPRHHSRDIRLARKEKVDVLFLPSVKTMYPQGHLTTVRVKKITQTLCGAFRLRHFDGVTTIVAKLLNIVGPVILYLGQKDAQQAGVIRQMVEDLNFPAQIKVLPIVREPNGLAMSSRNRYLTEKQRNEAAMIYRALRNAKQKIKNGERDAKKIIKLIRSSLRSVSIKKIDYVQCVDAQTLEDVSKIKGTVLIALAVWFGKTRLIDNIVVRKK